MKILRYIMALGVVGTLLSSCSENEYKVYDTTQKDSVFFSYVNSKNQADSVYDFRFDFDINNYFTLSIPVSVMGSVKDYDRTVKVEIVPDSSTMVEGTHFEIIEARVPAGATDGVVKINFLRDKDPELLTRAVKGRFVIGENDDLRSVKGSAFKVTYSDIRPEGMPAWWLTSKPFPVYSYENAQLYFEYFHRLAPEADLDIYNEIVATYGPYYMEAGDVRGPWVMYESFIRHYVCIPLHRDHPEIEFYTDPEW